MTDYDEVCGGRTFAKPSLFIGLATSIIAGLMALPINASATDLGTSVRGTGEAQFRDADLPSLLSATDAELYRQIFASQEKGRLAEADRLIARLQDPLLLGTVQAQRYLGPYRRTSYAELQTWLVANPDAPEARAIYAMALKRKTPGTKAPPAPIVGGADAGFRRAAADGAALPDDTKARALIDEIRQLARSNPASAEKLLAGREAQRLLKPGTMDDFHHAVAHVDPSDADTADGIEREPQGQDWEAGLAAWRHGRYEEARRHFETMARSPDESPWGVAAAAFWAARVELRSRKPELFNYWLGIAATHPRTFYGLLARRTLGIDTYFDFESDRFTELDTQILTGVPAARRALAFIQIGDEEHAQAELMALASRASPNLVQSLVALAERANLPTLSLRIAGHLTDADPHHDRALYPMPRWTPSGGFTVDRALLYGVMRQESRFKTVAHNPSGASGLMQLMPRTAKIMAARAGVPFGSQDALADPEINMAIAQEYILELLNDPHVRGNLFYLAVAYNQGEGGLHRDLTEARGNSDPLLFIECISNRETRAYTHQVMTNYWIYRLRLHQPTHDLDALAAGEWPIYTALDNRPEPLTRHAENR
jgi:soluble lytic murein transglycosylase